MTSTSLSIQQTFQTLVPFDQLPAEALQQLLQTAQPLRYRVGQPLLRREVLTQQVIVLLEGQARLLGYDPRTEQPVTLGRFGRGEILGVISLIRGVPCETVIASTEVLALTLPSYTFLNLLNEYPEFGGAVRDRVYGIEAFDLVAEHAKAHALDFGDLKAKAQKVCDESAIVTLPSGPHDLANLEATLTWVLSGGTVLNIPVGSTLALDRPVDVISPQGARVLGMTPAVLAEALPEPVAEPEAVARPVEVLDVNNIPYATEADLAPRSPESSQSKRAPMPSYPFARGRGEVNGALACFDMLSQHFSMPFRKDVIRRILANQHERIRWQDSFAVALRNQREGLYSGRS
jgi:hypothetical protein